MACSGGVRIFLKDRGEIRKAWEQGMKKVLIVTNNQNTRKKLENIVKEQNPGNTIYITDNLERAYHIISVTTIHLFLIDMVLQPRQRGGDVRCRFCTKCTADNKVSVYADNSIFYTGRLRVEHVCEAALLCLCRKAV